MTLTFVLIAAFLLYLLDNRKLKWVLLCLLPAFIILPAFFRMKTPGGWAFYTGLILIGLSPLLEGLFSKLEPKLLMLRKRGSNDHRLEKKEDMIAEGPEEDILDNKKKWRLIVSGYVIFIVFALLSIGAFFTLNMKINNIYEFSNSQQEVIEQQQKLIGEQQKELEKLKSSNNKITDRAENK